DSAGLALLNEHGEILRKRSTGRVTALQEKVASDKKMAGKIGIAHTRWATHGKPTLNNAHPHICNETVGLVHNGIIENHESLKASQEKMGYRFTSNTDTEVIVHQLHHNLEQSDSLFSALENTVKELEGAYSLAVISNLEPGNLVVARQGSPLVIGLCEGENFIASDVSALISKTRNFIFLEEGDVACITTEDVRIVDFNGKPVERKIHQSKLNSGAVELGEYRHYMLKEIYEQPTAVSDTLEGRLSGNHLLAATFGHEADEIFNSITNVQIIACGTSFHAGLVARYWMEELAGVATSVEVASEFRYRSHVVPENCLVITISQSGETADTLAALKYAREIGYKHSLCICNVAESSLTRESDMMLLTHAGPEIGVASTKAFTTQLIALMMVVIAIGKRNSLSTSQEERIVRELRSLPVKISEALELDAEIAKIAEKFAKKRHALFLGRGTHFPIAMEGALKLKEVSYIHAEAYPAGELKHGPLALIDNEVPVIAVAPNNELLEKLKSNIQEVRARGGELIVFAEPGAGFKEENSLTVIEVAPVDDIIAPIIFTIPLQLLAYRVALIKGTDVDKPRNLAKSVTVE
ncbi:MAG: glutamine--fructose-6-phosphate transaminase (isomerizing), partial [Gammaproteobacteria bacterium]|nr:glutamine--fructose-6-phosphate transaminase (isomerizing) [Gammaproteobacteria bacterium]MDX2486674.1 glutamine--fructose-6-phosphate transaminase (isomerizing) [Gammaproteobacteria bacterium]